MTAPLLSSFLAVLFACLGYLAGRVHQWHRGAWDREEAYRAGHEEATRSTLSMAARMAANARPPASSAAASSAGPAVPASPGGRVAPADRAGASSRPTGAHGDVRGRRSPGDSLETVTPPIPAEPGTPQAPAAFVPAQSGAFDPGAGFVASGSGVSDAAAGLVPDRAGAFGAGAGFVSAGPGGVDEGAAFTPDLGGARSGAFFEPVVQEPGPVVQKPDPVDEVPVPRLGRRGRHYVPDELVRAATYRLAPDRVARAKVPGAQPPEDDDTPDPPHQHVPRPRSS
ncbi:hypothetical protein AB0M20_44325 [Actinoplanes sp. NPDC051633]|uniref:hypothetical protein n=1 Tax=Actinoplanes sp. NPDC051633 TaxID=3155670 RepID=UPI0034386D8C